MVRYGGSHARPQSSVRGPSSAWPSGRHSPREGSDPADLAATSCSTHRVSLEPCRGTASRAAAGSLARRRVPRDALKVLDLSRGQQPPLTTTRQCSHHPRTHHKYSGNARHRVAPCFTPARNEAFGAITSHWCKHPEAWTQLRARLPALRTCNPPEADERSSRHIEVSSSLWESSRSSPLFWASRKALVIKRHRRHKSPPYILW